MCEPLLCQRMCPRLRLWLRSALAAVIMAGLSATAALAWRCLSAICVAAAAAAAPLPHSRQASPPQLVLALRHLTRHTRGSLLPPLTVNTIPPLTARLGLPVHVSVVRLGEGGDAACAQVRHMCNTALRLLCVSWDTGWDTGRCAAGQRQERCHVNRCALGDTSSLHSRSHHLLCYTAEPIILCVHPPESASGP